MPHTPPISLLSAVRVDGVEAGEIPIGAFNIQIIVKPAAEVSETEDAYASRG
jgi:hypothetical protein